MGLPSAESWDAFFTDFYLRAYADDERDAEAREQALAAVRLAGVPEGGDVLDVPCGFGRHVLPLAEAGYRAVGADRSRALLDEARRRAGGARHPRLVEADYRELPFADASFDAVLCLFSSLGYLGDAEDARAIAEFARVLRPGGRLVIETMHRDKLIADFRPNDWRLLGEGRLLLEQRTFDLGTGVTQATQTLIGPDGERDSRTFSMRVYTATELAAMTSAAGLGQVRCYGDLDGAPLSPESRLILVAQSSLDS